ncbi:MAG: immunity 53 family protein [Cyanobacteria bacterium J06626_18]
MRDAPTLYVVDIKIAMAVDYLKWIQEWYVSNCNGDWEHSFGVTLETLDNPGWSIAIDLQDTALEDKLFQDVEIERTEGDWVLCKVKSRQFKVACGPFNLIEAIGIFYDWVNDGTSRE